MFLRATNQERFRYRSANQRGRFVPRTSQKKRRNSNKKELRLSLLQPPFGATGCSVTPLLSESKLCYISESSAMTVAPTTHQSALPTALLAKPVALCTSCSISLSTSSTSTTEDEDVDQIMDVEMEVDKVDACVSALAEDQIDMRAFYSLEMSPKACSDTIPSSKPTEEKVPEEVLNQSLSSSTRVSKIGFGEVTVREYPIIVGENPGVVKGVPITIGWDHLDESNHSVEDYEQARASQRKKVQEEGLKLNPVQRQKMLLGLGFSMAAIQRGADAATRVQTQRRNTRQTLCASKFHEAMESLKRKTRNVCTFGKYKKMQRQLLNQTANPAA